MPISMNLEVSGTVQADYDTGTNENDGHFRRLGDTGGR
jgi:hypothetical protein